MLFRHREWLFRVLGSALARWASLACIGGVAACSGAEFTAQTDAGCPPAECAGASSGGTGGMTNGGATASGGVAGGVTGTAGAEGGRSGASFPATGVLDDFNRVDGAVGLDWIGSDAYTIVEGQLRCVDCGSAVLWAAPFGADQEAFATLTGFDGGTAEINLVLKAQTSTTCELVEVLYSPSQEQASLAYCVGGVWTVLAPTVLVLVPGDQFGGRARSDGTIEIIAKGSTIAVVDASAFPYETGRIGVDGIRGITDLRWDDFGGGNWK
jgi:hypothetical protein